MKSLNTESPRLLVVGATGFIGRHVVAEGRRRGWTVTALSLVPRTGAFDSKVETVFADVANQGELTVGLPNPSYEYVVYCGGYVDHASFFHGGQESMITKGRGVFNLVGLLNREVLRAFVNVGSSEEYGNHSARVSEEHAGKPRTPYALSHLNVTNFLEMLSESEGFPGITLRLFLAYGPGQMPPRLVARVVAHCLRNESFPVTLGDQIRDFCYIDDIVAAIFMALQNQAAIGGVFNIATGTPTPVRTVIEQIVAMTGGGTPAFGDLAIRHSEPSSLFADTSKAHTVLGWEPRITLEDGLRRTVSWCESQGASLCDPSALNGDKRRLIRVSRSVVGAEEKRHVLHVLDRQFLGMGTEVQAFEEALTKFFGRPAVCVVNGTAALHLAFQACGLGPGDEVLVPSLTYVATFQAVSATGAKPVACEVSPETCVLDWRDAERRLTPRTRAVVTVHYAGGVGDLDGIYAFAARHGLRVIEDAAHAFGTTHRGKRVGSFGDIACFSFDGIKTVTSGEGGCIVTDDPLVLERTRDARLLGVEHDTEKRYEGQRSWQFDVHTQGWRYHMSNIMAAIGLEQIKRFSRTASDRQRLAEVYDGVLGDHAQIRPVLRSFQSIVPHIYVVRIKGLSDRPALRTRLLEHGIQTGIHYQPNHQLTLYRDDEAPLPVTEALFPELLTLPLHTALSTEEVKYICSTLESLIA